jgi:hypothetical protein
MTTNSIRPGTSAAMILGALQAPANPAFIQWGTDTPDLAAAVAAEASGSPPQRPLPKALWHNPSTGS